MSERVLERANHRHGRPPHWCPPAFDQAGPSHDSMVHQSIRIAAVALALAGVACSGDDDAGDPTTVAPTEESAGPTSGSTPTAGPAITPVVTEAPVPTIDDTDAVGGSRLYSVDLQTGATTALGRIGGEEVGVLGLAFAPSAGASTVYGLTDQPGLITFDPAEPATLVTSLPITGVAAGSTLLAIDVDPADSRVLALSDAGVLYALDPATGAATAIGDGLGAPIPDPGLGFDIDPASGLIRVDVATGEQLLVDPATGALDDSPASLIAFDPDDVNAPATPRIVAIATSEDRLYGIDAATGSLVVQDAAGVLTTLSSLDVDLTDGASLDIATTGDALLAIPG